MTARTTSRTRLIAAVSATAGALALTLLPTTAAYAALPTVPIFSYVDNATLVPSAGGADASSPSSLAPGYRAYDVDVTPDGSTSVMSLCNGTVAACSDMPAGSRFDGTYGIVYLRADGARRLLTNLTNTNPVITADGKKVMWVYAKTLHTFLTASGTYAPDVALAVSATELPVRLAVSSDGAQVAVLLNDDAVATAARVLAISVATGKAAGASFFEKTYPRANALRPSPWVFTFVDATTLVYDEFDGTTAGVRSAVKAVLSVDNVTPAVALSPLLQNYYQLRKDDGGFWWAWKDAGTGATATATVANIDDPLAATPVLTAGPTRTDGGTTYGYTPSTVVPPTLGASSLPSNPATSHPTFTFSAATVAYNGRSAYQSYNLYGGLPNGAFAIPANAAETDRGVLESSFNGTTFTPVLTTTGARAFVLGTQYYNGYATLLRRTVYYRWTWKGDAFTTAFTSPVRKITVIPNVYAKVTKSGASRIVSGTITRPAGTVSLYKLVTKTRYSRIASVRIARASAFGGSYSFGKRKLAKGTYKVVSAADAYAGSGLKVFKI